ncbi:hypothetical protein NUK47_07460 [Aeromonas hydrophila]|uniref:hypothetical protein n=1 Tax=Aeromonas hydrophila TaxID=644 RepID=UPI00214DBA67|nr:hypothetical protein [Aeromonas hydrophila]MCR3908614.1 hypothetical protein [Aeromonas hydrophila]
MEFIKSGEVHDVFNQSIHITEEESFSLEKTDLHILDWLEEHKKSEQRNLVIRTVVLPAVLSDMLHCIFEGLSASKKGKMAVSFMLLRKPLQESLYLLESMAIDKSSFVEHLSKNPLFLRPKNGGGPVGHAQRIDIVLGKIGLRKIFSSQYISELRYDKKSYDSFDRVCNHAMHLFTEHSSIKTDLLNINFIFSGAEQIYSQQRYLYTRLPYLLYYIYCLFEHIANDIAPTTTEYIENVNRRISAYFLIAYIDMDNEFITDEMHTLAKFFRIALRIEQIQLLDSSSIIKRLVHIAETGLLTTNSDNQS